MEKFAQFLQILAGVVPEYCLISQQRVADNFFCLLHDLAWFPLSLLGHGVRRRAGRNSGWEGGRKKVLVGIDLHAFSSVLSTWSGVE